MPRVTLSFSLGLLLFSAIGIVTAIRHLSDVPPVLNRYTRGGRRRRITDATNGETHDKEGTTTNPYGGGTFRILKATQIHDPYSSTLDSVLVDKLNAFGLRLFARLSSHSSTSSKDAENVVISPTSIATVLTMVSLGTTDNSVAEAEMLALFGGERGFASPSSSTNGGGGQQGIQLEVANSAWVGGLVLESYKRIIQTTMDAQIFPLPKDVSEVNDWVNEQTHGTIPTILTELPRNLAALLINAVFFNAPWTYKFDVGDTLENEPFYGPRGFDDGQVKTVAMMQMRGQTFPCTEVGIPSVGRSGTTGMRRVQIVDLPYGPQEEYSATFLVPSDPDITLSDIILVLNGDANSASWNDWMRRLSPTSLDVVAVPRFKIEYGAKELKDVLQSMGMTSVFVGDTLDPPLQRMTGDADTFVSKVLHRSTLECNEEGTTASATTAAEIQFKSLPPSIRLNRPFLMAIRNRSSGAIIFMAKVEDP